MTQTADHQAPGAALFQAMTDDQFLAAWRDCVSSGDQERIALIEGSAHHRFPLGQWREHYAARYPDQTHYVVPEVRQHQ